MKAIFLSYSAVFIGLIGWAVGTGGASANDQLVIKYCGECHMNGATEGELELDVSSIDWSDEKISHDWESVYLMVSREVMPPPDAEQPNTTEREELLQWLDAELNKHLPLGGGAMRRLSQREYRNTLRAVFDLPKFDLPLGFPPDNELDGFDNQSVALSIAPSHLDAYVETATLLADEFFPPPPRPVAARTVEIPPGEMVVSYSSACLIDGAMRLASSGTNIVRHATWPSKFEAPASGTYTIEVDASSFQQESDSALTLRVASMFDSKRGAETKKDLRVPANQRQTFRFDVELERGETIVLRYHDGPLDYEAKDEYRKFLTALFQREPSLAAAWNAVGEPPRGGSGWTRVSETLAKRDFDATEFIGNGEIQESNAAIDKLVRQMVQKNVNSGETIVYKFFEEGPYVAIHGLSIHGPTEQRPDADQLRIQRQRKRFLGDADGAVDEATLTQFYNSLLTRLFRRPATEQEVDSYVELVIRAAQSDVGVDAGHHLALRTVLLSPSFLFVTDGDESLSQYELASRLAYFLTSSPPDQVLMELAKAGKLDRAAVLQKQALRLINKDFSRDFTRQWLGLAALDSLMPDPRLIAKFTPGHRSAMLDEVTETFHHVLENNLPVSDLISPDFVFTDGLVGWDIYGLEQFKPPKKKSKTNTRAKMQKIDVPREGRVGGLLCMPAVMMATANGVDTQPVLRGVWMLNNILGSPPPEPPNSVPALTPDTTGATTPKQRLAAHMSEASCAVCHREIDPLGFVLENFDPIGRWRDHYPTVSAGDADTAAAATVQGAGSKDSSRSGNKRELVTGIAVDATGKLPGGFELRDVTDLKRFLAENPEIVARCLGEKLLTYATGHRLNHRQRQIVARIVGQQQEANGLKLQDLLLALIDSDVFQTK